jgi:hypothetical protein
MPNWCNNFIELEHSDSEMISRAATALEKGTFLDEFIPVPTEVAITVAGNVGEKGSPEQIAHELKIQQNIEEYGYADWYTFCVNEWGTKWDLGGNGTEVKVSASGTSLTVSVDSAWSPPIQAYEKLEAMGFTIKAYYYEPGMCYAGIYSDGCDDYYDYSDMNSEEVRETLPAELDEMFNIANDMAEWEEENEEE